MLLFLGLDEVKEFLQKKSCLHKSVFYVDMWVKLNEHLQQIFCYMNENNFLRNMIVFIYIGGTMPTKAQRQRPIFQRHSLKGIVQFDSCFYQWLFFDISLNTCTIQSRYFILKTEIE